MDAPTASRRRRRLPIAALILIAMLLGVVAGVALGDRAEPLSKLGSIIIDLIKGLAGPLLFFAVLDAFLRTRIEARSGGILVAISLTNAFIAIGIGLTLSNTLHPGRWLRVDDTAAVSLASGDLSKAGRGLDPGRRISLVDEVVGLVPTSLFRPLVENAVISIVAIAILLGAALRTVKNDQIARGISDYTAIERCIATSYAAVEVVLSWAIRLVPLAVFGVVARTVGRYGFRPFGGLVVYLGVGILGLALQVGVVYQIWIKFVARMPLARFWSGAKEAIAYAMGTASSLATLPVTLKTLDRMGVSPQSARLAACVGTNLNNDGILLYEAMAVLFLAQANGVDLSVGQQVVAAGACAVAGIGISGVPEAGLISLIIVARTVGLDERYVPMLLTVDWVLGRCRAMTNVASDIVVAVLLDRFARPPESVTLAPQSSDRTDDPDGI